jgi:hypothetical protein
MGMGDKRHAPSALPAVKSPSSPYTDRAFSSQLSSSTSRGIGKMDVSLILYIQFVAWLQLNTFHLCDFLLSCILKCVSLFKSIKAEGYKCDIKAKHVSATYQG